MIGSKRATLKCLVMISSLGAMLSGLAVPAFAADDYPSRAIRLIAPVAPGGQGDAVARLIGKHLSVLLKQSVIVDNKTGASGVIGTSEVIKAAPDGYTLLINPVGGLTTALIKAPPFDVMNDLAPVSAVCTGGYVLFVNSQLPVSNVRELIEYARANPGKVAVGVPSASSTLGFEVFKRVSKMDALVVPYRGSAPTINGLIGGEIQASFDGPGAYKGFIDTGRLRAIMFSGSSRLATLPGVPTAAEAGYPQYTSGYVDAVWAPVGTPRPVIDRLSAAIAEVMAIPAVQQSLREMGLQPVSSTPEVLRQMAQVEVDFYKQAATAVGYKPE